MSKFHKKFWGFFGFSVVFSKNSKDRNILEDLSIVRVDWIVSVGHVKIGLLEVFWAWNACQSKSL